MNVQGSKEDGVSGRWGPCAREALPSFRAARASDCFASLPAALDAFASVPSFVFMSFAIAPGFIFGSLLMIVGSVEIRGLFAGHVKRHRERFK